MEGKKINTKLVLFTLILVLIVLLLLNYFFENNRNNGIWDYENIDSAKTIINQSTINNDREVYYNLEKIIQEYVNSYFNNQIISDDEETKTYEDYYTCLTENYKKYLSKNEYIEVAKKFLDKFYVTAESEIESREFMDTEQILKIVYEFDNNIYLCDVESSYNEEIGYIAIQLDLQNGRYHIVYIE